MTQTKGAHPGRDAAIGAGVGVIIAEAYVVGPALLSGDTYELSDAVVVMGPIGAVVGAGLGTMVAVLLDR